MIFHTTEIDKALTIDFKSFKDERGLFVKSFNDDLFRAQGIDFKTKESYFSTSKKNVIRGMHFQTPPHQHAKIVFCPVGAILDVILDLRKDSPSFGKYVATELSSENYKAYYIPEGCAHGFKALSEDAMIYYLVSSVYDAQSDTGIRYDSFGFDWDCPNPLISERDATFPMFNDFKSPF